MELWTKRALRTVSAAVFFLVAVGCGIIAWIGPRTEETMARQENRDYYYAVLEGEMLSIYDGADGEMILFSRVKPGGMIPRDREMLETGITLSTVEEALSLIEDFGS